MDSVLMHSATHESLWSFFLLLLHGNYIPGLIMYTMWKCSGSSAKTTLYYTRQLPSERAICYHLSPTGVATSPSSAWFRRRAFKATASWKWCCDVPRRLVPLMAGIFGISAPTGWIVVFYLSLKVKFFFQSVSYLFPVHEMMSFISIVAIWTLIPWSLTQDTFDEMVQDFSHQLHSREPTNDLEVEI